MPARRLSADDACPGALRLHAAADGPLARVRLPGGMLTGGQLAVLAELAARWGDGALELTSRANIQLRALRADPEELATRLSAAGLLPSLAHETVRNIAAPPLADRETRALVDAFDRALCADPALAALPGRFLFAVGSTPLAADVAAVRADDCGSAGVAAAVRAEDCGSAGVAAAVRAEDCGSAGVAAEAAQVAGHGAGASATGAAGCWAVLPAGRDLGIRVSTGEVVAALLAVAHAFLAEQAGCSPKPWRLREIPDGPARIARRLRPGLAARAGASTAIDAAGWDPTSEAPLVGVLGDPSSSAVGALVPLGRLTGVQLKLLAQAERLVVTPGGGIVVPDLTPAATDRWLRELRAAGLATESDSKWAGVTTCAGRPGCGKALADVRADAAATARYVPGRRVHWVGCERGCGTPAGEHVRVEASADGYLVDGEPVGGEDLGEVVAARRA